MKKKLSWSGNLELRSINAKLAYFDAMSKDVFNQFKEEKILFFGKSKISLRQWRPDDMIIKNVKGSSHWIGIRGLPFHHWDFKNFESISSSWGRVLEIHKSTIIRLKL